MREFLREQEFSPDEGDSGKQDKSREKLPTPGILLEIYKEQFRYIQKLEGRDFGLFIMVIGVVSILWVIGAVSFIDLSPHLLWGVILMMIFLSASANHITIKRATVRWSRFITLGQIEKALGLRKSGIIPASTHFVLPVSFGDFLVRFLTSPSGPKSLVYTSIMGMAIVEIQWELLNIHRFSFFFLFLLIPVIFLLMSVYANYMDIIHQFKAMKGEVELAATTRMKSPADHYCDVADALLQMRPPLPSEALRHFREALRMEPDNVRAKVGFDKLMNFKFKNVN